MVNHDSVSEELSATQSLIAFKESQLKVYVSEKDWHGCYDTAAELMGLKSRTEGLYGVLRRERDKVDRDGRGVKGGLPGTESSVEEAGERASPTSDEALR